MYFHRSSFGPVDLAFTDRFGGVSGVPYDELNLALESDDDPASLAENHRRVLTDFAPTDVVADLHQVHGATEPAKVPVGVTASKPRGDADFDDDLDVPDFLK